VETKIQLFKDKETPDLTVNCVNCGSGFCPHLSHGAYACPHCGTHYRVCKTDNLTPTKKEDKRMTVDIVFRKKANSAFYMIMLLMCIIFAGTGISIAVFLSFWGGLPILAFVAFVIAIMIYSLRVTTKEYKEDLFSRIAEFHRDYKDNQTKKEIKWERVQ